MTLRTYIIFAVVAFLIVAMWLWPKVTSILLFVMAGAGVVFVFYYAIMRLFMAIRSQARTLA